MPTLYMILTFQFSVQNVFFCLRWKFVGSRFTMVVNQDVLDCQFRVSTSESLPIGRSKNNSEQFTLSAKFTISGVNWWSHVSPWWQIKMFYFANYFMPQYNNYLLSPRSSPFLWILSRPRSWTTCKLNKYGILRHTYIFVMPTWCVVKRQRHVNRVRATYSIVHPYITKQYRISE